MIYSIARRRPRALTALALAICIITWASAYSAIRVALEAYTPAQVAFLRCLASSLILAVYGPIKHIRLPARRDLPAIALAGLFGFTIYNLGLIAGEETVLAGIASFISSSEVAMLAVLAAVFLGERLSIAGWIGIGLCIIGIALISFADAEVAFKGLPGVLLVLVGTLSVSLYSIVQHPLLRKYSVFDVTTYAIWAGTFFLLFTAPDAWAYVSTAPAEATLAVMYLGIFPGTVAYVAWSYILSQMETSRAGSFLAITPIAALGIAWLWLGEIPQTLALIGGVITLAGVIVVNRRGRQA